MFWVQFLKISKVKKMLLRIASYSEVALLFRNTFILSGKTSAVVTMNDLYGGYFFQSPMGRKEKANMNNEIVL